MRFLIAGTVLLHGLIHLLGFVAAFDLVPIPALNVSGLVGILWLIAAAVFVAAAALLAMGNRAAWLVVTVPAVVLSQALIIGIWSQAKFGTLANVLILTAVLVEVLDRRAGSYRTLYAEEVTKRLIPSSMEVVLRELDIADLPAVVQKYLRRTGSVGRSQIDNFRVTMRGTIRRSSQGDWMKFAAEQHSFVREPARLFLMRALKFRVPFEALHRYTARAATMQVRLAALFDIVDARGPEMQQSETVTMFNDMCILAPATLVDRRISWQEIEPLKVLATFRVGATSISAVLSFDEAGDLLSFYSDDRYLSLDGKNFAKFRWVTPVRDYRSFDGRRIATRGEASWRLPDGEFVYARVEFANVEYNVRIAAVGAGARALAHA